MLTLRGPRVVLLLSLVLICTAVVGAILGIYGSAEYTNCLAAKGGLRNLLTLTPCAALP